MAKLLRKSCTANHCSEGQPGKLAALRLTGHDELWEVRIYESLRITPDLCYKRDRRHGHIDDVPLHEFAHNAPAEWADGGLVGVVRCAHILTQLGGA